MNDDNTRPVRRRLTDILNDGAERLRDQWDTTTAAEDFAPLPAGVYIARIIGGELTTARSGTPGYKLTFRVLEGEHTGRQFWHDVWLTEAALPMAKRDLGKLGVKSIEQLEQPLPPGIRCRAKLALRRDDDGTEYNRLRSFEVLGIDPPEVDAFAPTDSGDSDTLATCRRPQAPPDGFVWQSVSGTASPTMTCLFSFPGRRAFTLASRLPYGNPSRAIHPTVQLGCLPRRLPSWPG